MTHHADEPTLRRRPLTQRRRWIWLAAIAVLPLILATVELTRWRPLPDLPAESQEIWPASESPEAEQARQVVRAWMADERVAGLATCIGIEGEVAWCSAHGYAELEEGVPLTARTSMRLGSVSKPLTAILLARFVEHDLVGLDQPIGRVVPNLPAHLQQVTLRQLASHTAGIRHYRWRPTWPPHETWSRIPYDSVTESLAIFAEDPLIFAPGSDFSYSSHGYTLLGAVLERVGGASFEELLAREIAHPLGLDSTGLDSPRHALERARPYEIVGDRYRDALPVDNSRAWPGAGIRSSASNLARLVSGLGDGRLIDSETLELILTPQALPGGSLNSENYALGWRLAETREFLGGRETYRVAHHGGVSSGSSAFVAFFPDQSLAVVVLTNSRKGSGPLSTLAFDVAEPFMAKIVQK